jgi:hypothetical protein
VVRTKEERNKRVKQSQQLRCEVKRRSGSCSRRQQEEE